MKNSKAYRVTCRMIGYYKARIATCTDEEYNRYLSEELAYWETVKSNQEAQEDFINENNSRA